MSSLHMAWASVKEDWEMLTVAGQVCAQLLHAIVLVEGNRVCWETPLPR